MITVMTDDCEISQTLWSVRALEFWTSSPFWHFDAEPVAEVVDVLGVVLHHCHVMTRHFHVQSPVRCVRRRHDLFHLVFVFFFLWLKSQKKYISLNNYQNKSIHTSHDFWALSTGFRFLPLLSVKNVSTSRSRVSAWICIVFHLQKLWQEKNIKSVSTCHTKVIWQHLFTNTLLYIAVFKYLPQTGCRMDGVAL